MKNLENIIYYRARSVASAWASWERRWRRKNPPLLDLNKFLSQKVAELVSQTFEQF